MITQFERGLLKQTEKIEEKLDVIGQALGMIATALENVDWVKLAENMKVVADSIPPDVTIDINDSYEDLTEDDLPFP